MGKEHKGCCSWGAKREGKGEIGLERQRVPMGKEEFCSSMLNLKSGKASVEPSSKRWKLGNGSQRVGLSQRPAVESYQHIRS